MSKLRTIFAVTSEMPFYMRWSRFCGYFASFIGWSGRYFFQKKTSEHPQNLSPSVRPPENDLKSSIRPMETERDEEMQDNVESLVFSLVQTLSESDEGVSLDFGSFDANSRFSETQRRYEHLPMEHWTSQYVLFPGRRKSNKRFARFCSVLAIMYAALVENFHITKRDLYYLLPDLCDHQRESDAIIDDLCAVFCCKRIALHVIASPRGLAQGDLEFRNNRRLISCKAGLTIQPFTRIDSKSIRASFKFILVTEKETVFRNICADDNFLRQWPCLVVTGKGYPCLATRHFLKTVLAASRVSCFILVDADVYGLEIYCEYKYGNTKRCMEDVALPDIIPIGLSISEGQIQGQELPVPQRDKTRLSSLTCRPYAAQDSYLVREISQLKQRNKKAEIECLWEKSPNYLTQVYLPEKLKKYFTQQSLE
eukprot:g32466.t1